MFKHKVLSVLLLVGILLGQSVPGASAATFCDQAQFVSDITVPDGAAFTPGASFTKTWRFMNAGTCTWTTSYRLVYAGGDGMGSTAPVNFPVSVAPGQMLDISVNLTAPSTAGHYKSLWKFANASGGQFGIGDSAGNAFWVDINVVPTDAVIYDFVANAPYAQWKSGAGTLPYPGTSGDRRGYSYQLDRPHLEDDSFDSLPGLLTVPENKYDGYIQATYPELQVQKGDKLQTLVNCEFGANGCYVTFRVDYLLPSGARKILWQWKEAPDKRFYRANLDLSPLAGQKVRFILMLLSSGVASNDRAIWGSPRIVRSGTVQPPAPPATLTPLPPLTPTPTPIAPPPPTVVPAGCDRATFITDVNVPDGTIFSPGAAFSKTWRLKNSGSCIWTKEYKLVYYSGDVMNAQTAVNMPYPVYPGETVDITVNMAAPGASGSYRSYWILANANGTMFGIGSTASKPFWVDIRVAGDPPQENGYNFWLNACAAEWRSGAGALPCPGTNGDRRGFVIADNFSHLEDGTMGPAPTLLLSPENKYNGYIRGFYPAITVQPGDHFRAVVGCDYGTSCAVTFRLDYMNPNGYIGNFWQRREINDKKNYTVDVDLSPLAGRSVRFILTILATGSATGDRVRWGAPMIIPSGKDVPPITPLPPTSTPIPPPTATPTSSTGDWLTYANPTFGFEFKYPPQAQIVDQQVNFVRINLPIIPGTNLGEKYLETTVTENPQICQSPFATRSMLATSETVSINGMSFLKQTGGDAGAGNFYDWVAYSTLHNNDCVSMGFVLHSHNAGNFDPPIPVFDVAAESAVFLQMVQTLTWTPSTPTPQPLAYAQSVVDTLNGHNFAALPPLMDESFVFAYWQSQGTSYPSDQAIEQLQVNHIGASPLTSDPGIDLTALLGGMNPYSVMGLDPAKSQALFVSGWGLDGKGEAVLYITQRTDGSLYWHSVLVAPSGFTPPTALIGPYAVILVAENDVLNIRSGAGVSHPVVGSFPPDAINVMRTGPVTSVAGAEWVQVQNPGGGIGWVNSYYLTEYVSHDAFCADTRIAPLIQQLKASMNQSSGALLSPLVSPKHGVRVHWWAYQPAVHFTPAQAVNAFTSTEIFNWGSGPRGEPDYSTFAGIIPPSMLDVLNASNMETYCDNLTKVYPLFRPWPYPGVRYYNLHRPGTPEVEMDFRTWLVGIEYINGEPYIFGLVTVVWEP